MSRHRIRKEEQNQRTDSTMKSGLSNQVRHSAEQPPMSEAATELNAMQKERRTAGTQLADAVHSNFMEHEPSVLLSQQTVNQAYNSSKHQSLANSSVTSIQAKQRDDASVEFHCDRTVQAAVDGLSHARVQPFRERESGTVSRENLNWQKTREQPVSTFTSFNNNPSGFPRHATHFTECGSHAPTRGRIEPSAFVQDQAIRIEDSRTVTHADARSNLRYEDSSVGPKLSNLTKSCKDSSEHRATGHQIRKFMERHNSEVSPSRQPEVIDEGPDIRTWQVGVVHPAPLRIAVPSVKSQAAKSELSKFAKIPKKSATNSLAPEKQTSKSVSQAQKTASSKVARSEGRPQAPSASAPYAESRGQPSSKAPPSNKALPSNKAPSKKSELRAAEPLPKKKTKIETPAEPRILPSNETKPNFDTTKKPRATVHEEYQQPAQNPAVTAHAVKRKSKISYILDEENIFTKSNNSIESSPTKIENPNDYEQDLTSRRALVQMNRDSSREQRQMADTNPGRQQNFVRNFYKAKSGQSSQQTSPRQHRAVSQVVHPPGSSIVVGGGSSQVVGSVHHQQQPSYPTDSVVQTSEQVGDSQRETIYIQIVPGQHIVGRIKQAEVTPVAPPSQGAIMRELAEEENVMSTQMEGPTSSMMNARGSLKTPMADSSTVQYRQSITQSMVANSSDHHAQQVSVSHGFNMSEPEVAMKNTISNGPMDLISTKEPSHCRERSIHSIERQPIPPLAQDKERSISTLLTNVVHSQIDGSDAISSALKESQARDRVWTEQQQPMLSSHQPSEQRRFNEVNPETSHVSSNQIDSAHTVHAISGIPETPAPDFHPAISSSDRYDRSLAPPCRYEVSKENILRTPAAGAIKEELVEQTAEDQRNLEPERDPLPEHQEPPPRVHQEEEQSPFVEKHGQPIQHHIQQPSQEKVSKNLPIKHSDKPAHDPIQIENPYESNQVHQQPFEDEVLVESNPFDPCHLEQSSFDRPAVSKVKRPAKSQGKHKKREIIGQMAEQYFNRRPKTKQKRGSRFSDSNDYDNSGVLYPPQSRHNLDGGGIQISSVNLPKLSEKDSRVFFNRRKGSKKLNNDRGQCNSQSLDLKGRSHKMQHFSEYEDRNGPSFHRAPTSSLSNYQTIQGESSTRVNGRSSWDAKRQSSQESDLPQFDPQSNFSKVLQKFQRMRFTTNKKPKIIDNLFIPGVTQVDPQLASHRQEPKHEHLIHHKPPEAGMRGSSRGVPQSPMRMAKQRKQVRPYLHNPMKEKRKSEDMRKPSSSPPSDFVRHLPESQSQPKNLSKQSRYFNLDKKHAESSSQYLSSTTNHVTKKLKQQKLQPIHVVTKKKTATIEVTKKATSLSRPATDLQESLRQAEFMISPKTKKKPGNESKFNKNELSPQFINLEVLEQASIDKRGPPPTQPTQAAEAEVHHRATDPSGPSQSLDCEVTCKKKPRIPEEGVTVTKDIANPYEAMLMQQQKSSMQLSELPASSKYDKDPSEHQIDSQPVETVATEKRHSTLMTEQESRNQPSVRKDKTAPVTKVTQIDTNPKEDESPIQSNQEKNQKKRLSFPKQQDYSPTRTEHVKYLKQPHQLSNLNSKVAPSEYSEALSGTNRIDRSVVIRQSGAPEKLSSFKSKRSVRVAQNRTSSQEKHSCMTETDQQTEMTLPMKFNKIISEKSKTKLPVGAKSIWKQQRPIPDKSTPPITPPKQSFPLMHSSRDISLQKQASVSSQMHPQQLLDRSDPRKNTKIERLGTVTNASQFRVDQVSLPDQLNTSKYELSQVNPSEMGERAQDMPSRQNTIEIQQVIKEKESDENHVSSSSTANNLKGKSSKSKSRSIEVKSKSQKPSLKKKPQEKPQDKSQERVKEKPFVKTNEKAYEKAPTNPISIEDEQERKRMLDQNCQTSFQTEKPKGLNKQQQEEAAQLPTEAALFDYEYLDDMKILMLNRQQVLLQKDKVKAQIENLDQLRALNEKQRKIKAQQKEILKQQQDSLKAEIAELDDLRTKFQHEKKTALQEMIMAFNGGDDGESVEEAPTPSIKQGADPFQQSASLKPEGKITMIQSSENSFHRPKTTSHFNPPMETNPTRPLQQVFIDQSSIGCSNLKKEAEKEPTNDEPIAENGVIKTAFTGLDISANQVPLNQDLAGHDEQAQVMKVGQRTPHQLVSQSFVASEESMLIHPIKSVGAHGNLIDGTTVRKFHKKFFNRNNNVVAESAYTNQQTLIAAAGGRADSMQQNLSFSNFESSAQHSALVTTTQGGRSHFRNQYQKVKESSSTLEGNETKALEGVDQPSRQPEALLTKADPKSFISLSNQSNLPHKASKDKMDIYLCGDEPPTFTPRKDEKGDQRGKSREGRPAYEGHQPDETYEADESNPEVLQQFEMKLTFLMSNYIPPRGSQHLFDWAECILASEDQDQKFQSPDPQRVFNQDEAEHLLGVYKMSMEYGGQVPLSVLSAEDVKFLRGLDHEMVYKKVIQTIGHLTSQLNQRREGLGQLIQKHLIINNENILSLLIHLKFLLDGRAVMVDTLHLLFQFEAGIKDVRDCIDMFLDIQSCGKEGEGRRKATDLRVYIKKRLLGVQGTQKQIIENIYHMRDFYRLFENMSAISSKSQQQVKNVMVFRRRNALRYVVKEGEATAKLSKVVSLEE